MKTLDSVGEGFLARRVIARRIAKTLGALVIGIAGISGSLAVAQSKFPDAPPTIDQPSGEVVGQRIPVVYGGSETMADILRRQDAEVRGRMPMRGSALVPNPTLRPNWPMRRSFNNKSAGLPADADVNQVASPGSAPSQVSGASRVAQTVSTTFDGPTFIDAFAFPPDTMGAVGPTQFLVTVNGRFRVYSKTGVAGSFDVDPDVFFASVKSPNVGAAFTFTSDPRVRYDRATGRWYIVMIDVPNSGNAINRVMIAVSDTATISSSTVWSFFRFSPSADFLDYPTLGVDSNALYIGGNMFGASSGNFVRTNGYVVQKSSILGAGPGVVTEFSGLVSSGAGAGPFTPQGVDNFDPTPTYGYFIGSDNAVFSLLQLRRISNPGSTTPTISGNLSLTVPTTAFPTLQNHLGNTGGASGRLDGSDDRLYQAVIRNGTLWTAHTIGVSNAGVASNIAARRNAARWYQIGNSLSTSAAAPTLVQSGTLFDPTAPNDANQRNYSYPAVMVNGQGHMAIGTSVTGTNERINAFTTGRLATDVLGTLQVTGAPATSPPYTNSTFAYNPPGDSGGSFGRRWGDYSYTSLDPVDDMTMWTIQEYTAANNVWGVKIAKLLAPPPATPTSVSPSSIPAGLASANVTVTGGVVSGSGFYDPGAGFTGRLAAAIGPGVSVNSATFVSPTSVTLNLNTIGSAIGGRTVTVTNPDGQSATSATNILTITASALAPSITSCSPGSGPVGTRVTISGSQFIASSGPTTITFTSNRNASGRISNTQALVLVPPGAVSGPITLTNANGSTTCNFTVTP